MEQGKIITILILAFKRKEFIQEAMESAINQSYPRDKYEVICSVGFHDKQLSAFMREHNIKEIYCDGTIGDSLREGLNASRGQIVAFLDDDDIFERDKLEKMVSKFDSYPDCNILLHFDADHLISENTIFNLAVSINSGCNIATCLNKPLKTKNLFQRILNVLTSPTIYLRETGEFQYPLIGHNGAYDRKAVQCIGKIPSGGAGEEIFILGKVLQNNLKYTIVTQSICYYTYPSNINDYFRSIKRMYSRAKTSVKQYSNICLIEDAKGHKLNVVDLIYKRPSINIIIRAVLSDPFASLFTPYVILVRWVAMHTGGIYTSDTWDSIESTKMLKI